MTPRYAESSPLGSKQSVPWTQSMSSNPGASPYFGRPLTLSPAKTLVTSMEDGLVFLGFHIQWKRKRGSNKWYMYTVPSQRAIQAVKQKIHDLTHRIAGKPGRHTETDKPDPLRLGLLFPARIVIPRIPAHPTVRMEPDCELAKSAPQNRTGGKPAAGSAA